MTEQLVSYTVGAEAGDEIMGLANALAARAMDLLAVSQPPEVQVGSYVSAVCIRTMIAGVCNATQAHDNDVLLGAGHALGQIIAILPDPTHRAAVLYAVCNAMAQTMVANAQVHDHVGGTQ